MDRRAQDEVEWVRSHVELERLYATTGNGVDSYYGYTNVIRRPVFTIRNDVEASLGAAMLAALAIGIVERDAMAEPRRACAPGRCRQRTLCRTLRARPGRSPALEPLMHALRAGA